MPQLGINISINIIRSGVPSVPSGTYVVDDDESFIDTGEGDILETE